jgi:hypothetical protein
MTDRTIQLNSNHQPATAKARVSSWQQIIWHEWHHCPDEAYAQHLFELVSNTYVGLAHTVLVILTFKLYGFLVGIWFYLVIRARTYLEGLVILPSLLIILGFTVAGAMVGMGLSQQLTWKKWLYLLTPEFKQELNILNTLFPACFIAGFFGLFPLLGAMLGIGLGLITFRPFLFQERAVTGLLSGIIFTTLGYIAATNDGWAIGASLLIGCWLGVFWRGIWLGLMMGWIGALPSVFIPGLEAYALRGLGLGLGAGLGAILMTMFTEMNARHAYAYRFWYVWWHRPPAMSQVETALYQACQALPSARKDWQKALQRLKQHPEQPAPVRELIARTQNLDWIERFVARHRLIATGGETIDMLKDLATDEAVSFHQTAIWLLQSIAAETAYQFSHQLEYTLCPYCLTRFGPRPVNISWEQQFTYYGCRVCGQSRVFLAGLPFVVAVLDTNWPEKQLRQNDQLYINWLAHRELFDFNRVKIIHATDEDVERFAVQVGNDTDPIRKPRYPRMPCLIGSEVKLSENTLRILESMFGQVEQMSEAVNA